MKKILLSAITLFSSGVVMAQDEPAPDNSFKIVGVITLLASLFLAVRALRNTRK